MITVNAPPGPVVAFTATPTTGPASLFVSFTNNSTGANPLTFAWDFETDGTVDATTKNASHTYTAVGTYTVTLTVTDKNGVSNSGTATITVSAAVPTCTVPNFTNQNQQTGPQTQVKWNAAGFTTTVVFNPTRPPEYKIKSQDPPAGSTRPCDTTVLTVFK